MRSLSELYLAEAYFQILSLGVSHEEAERHASWVSCRQARENNPPHGTYTAVHFE